MKQNITLNLDKKLIQKARVIAVIQESSVSRTLEDELARLLSDSERSDQ
jgi:hypothetical protein